MSVARKTYVGYGALTLSTRPLLGLSISFSAAGSAMRKLRESTWAAISATNQRGAPQ